jgi:hypothetical protein
MTQAILLADLLDLVDQNWEILPETRAFRKRCELEAKANV